MIVAAVVEVLGIALVCVVQNQHCHNSPAITHLYKITQFPSTLAMSASGLVISFELLVVLIWPGFSVQLISFYCLLLRGRFKKIFLILLSLDLQISSAAATSMQALSFLVLVPPI